MAAPVRKIVSIAKIECTGWQRQPNGTEEITVIAHLSDGSFSPAHVAQMFYLPNERQEIITRAMSGKGTASDLRRVMHIRTEREVKKQRLYGDVQRNYGQGLVDPCQP